MEKGWCHFLFPSLLEDGDLRSCGHDEDYIPSICPSSLNALSVQATQGAWDPISRPAFPVTNLSCVILPSPPLDFPGYLLRFLLLFMESVYMSYIYIYTR